MGQYFETVNNDTTEAIIEQKSNNQKETNQTIAQDAARLIPIANVTLMSKIATSGFWTPFINSGPSAGIQALTNTGALGAFTGATASGLGAATYDIDYKDDANANAPLTVIVAGGEDWDAIAALIQASIRTSTSALETVAVVAGEILFTSATTGAASACLVAAGTTGSGGGDILAAITALSADYTATLSAPIDGSATDDGTARPAGVYFGVAQTAAILIAGNVIGQDIIVAGVTIDEGKLVIENGKDLDTTIVTNGTDVRSLRSIMLSLDITFKNTKTSTAQENA